LDGKKIVADPAISQGLGGKICRRLPVVRPGVEITAKKEVIKMKVLVAVDKSEESQKALKYACHLLEHFDAKVDAVYVKPDESDTGAETLYAPFAGQEQKRRFHG
jgi:hypothetical protein